MESAKVDFKKMETEVMARCAFCKRILYTESYVDEVHDGHMFETDHQISGKIEKCPCRKESELTDASS